MTLKLVAIGLSAFVLAAAASPKCDPSTFTFPKSIIGTVGQSISADPVENFKLNDNSTNGISFCNLTVTYSRPKTDVVINVYVTLPLSQDAWNGRFIGVGGGGFAVGNVPPDETVVSISEGYSAATTDGGHALDDFFSSDWALRSPGNLNWEAVVDYSYRAAHDMAIIGKAMSEQYFGRPPEFSYFIGCSNGGRQGLAAAQRFPEDWNGVLASCPAIQTARLIVGDYWPQLVMRQLGEYPFPCELDALNQEAVKACEAVAQRTGKVHDDPDSCKFDAMQLVGTEIDCNGKRRPLSKAAAVVANAFWKGAENEQGEMTGLGHPIGTTMTGDVAVANIICDNEDEGGSSCRGNPLLLSDAFIRYWVTKDPDFNQDTLDHGEFDKIMHDAVTEFDGIVSANREDLSRFKHMSHKMLVWHTIGDQTVSVRYMRDYYDRVLQLDEGTRDFFRYFEVPGGLHCYPFEGPELNRGSLASLRKWVEEGIVPDAIPSLSGPLPDYGSTARKEQEPISINAHEIRDEL